MNQSVKANIYKIFKKSTLPFDSLNLYHSYFVHHHMKDLNEKRKYFYFYVLYMRDLFEMQLVKYLVLKNETLLLE